MLLFKELLPRELLKLIPWVKLLLPLGAPLVLIASVGTWPRDDPVLVCRVCCFKIGVWSRGRKEKKEEERGKKQGKKEGRKKRGKNVSSSWKVWHDEANKILCVLIKDA